MRWECNVQIQCTFDTYACILEKNILFFKRVFILLVISVMHVLSWPKITTVVRTDNEEWLSPSALPYIHTHVSTVCHLNTAMISQKWSLIKSSRQNNCDSQM